MNNTFIAKQHLQMAITNRNSEKPINDYIRFMDSLSGEERDKILQDKEITELVEKINRYHLG